MAAPSTFGNRIALVLLPVCAFSNKVIINKKLKAAVRSKNGTPLPGIHLVMKESGYLVFSSTRALEVDELEVILEVPGYLSGCCTFPVIRKSDQLREHRINLYPTRSILLGQTYTAICGTAEQGARILAYAMDVETNLRLMADVKKGDSEICIYSGIDNAEGRIIAAVDGKEKLLVMLETEEMIDFPNRYRLKNPSVVSLNRSEVKLISISITQPAPDGSFFLPLEIEGKESRSYTVIVEGQKTNTLIKKVVPGKENRLEQ